MNIHDPKPKVLTPIFDGIPAPLTKLPQWVLMRLEKPDHPGQKWKKMPCRLNGRYAAVNKPKTWSTFAEVRATYEKGGFDGIGYVFDGKIGPDGLCYVGCDFDNCIEINADGKHRINSDVKSLVHYLNSYTEVSVSGTGLHTIIRAKPLQRSVNGYLVGNKIEIYCTGRYFAFTGRSLRGVGL
jgi:putative DNA primase/helicase